MIIAFVSWMLMSSLEFSPLLLTHDQLQPELAQPDLRILDVRARAAYDKGHIPGALWIDAAAWTKLSGTPGGLENQAAWAQHLEPLGITPETRIVIIDGAKQLDAARVWWLLRYLGANRVGLVNGNFPLWEQAGRPVTTDLPTVTPCPFPVRFQKQRLATRADVLDSLQARSDRIIDARTSGEFSGKEKRAQRAGHIPDACHLEWSEFVTPEGRFLPEAELRKRIAEAGVTPQTPIITHCQGGGRASVSAFVFESLGFSTRNYYASWNDWGNAEDTPIVTDDPPTP